MKRCGPFYFPEETKNIKVIRTPRFQILNDNRGEVANHQFKRKLMVSTIEQPDVIIANVTHITFTGWEEYKLPLPESEGELS